MALEKELQNRREKMKKIKDDLLAMNGSALADQRIKDKVYPVIGEGSHIAEIMIIGEAPGANEAKQGRPFVGASGRFLNELLESVDIKREDVYITNIVKDRPPENRDPTPEEIDLYGTFLDQQIDIIQPKVIATLGRFSMVYIMKKFGLDLEIETISKAHGKAYRTKASYGSIDIFPLYHPAVALYNGSMRPLLKKDFEILKKQSKK
ncbi:MAG: uracil-DNA glycosylase [bacterium]|nr:uracil-DNA glycosylase [bacterium]